MIPGQEIELSFIAWFHKLLQHVDFLLTETKLQIYLSLDLGGGVHTTRAIDAEDDGLVFVADLGLQLTLHHVDDVLF
jgi:hypothetical protein